MAEQPSGTVTFLFTDIEGSARRWDLHREVMAAAVRRHDAILRGAIAAHEGFVFSTAGDGFCAAFADASDGLRAAVEAQRGLHAEEDTAAAGFEPLRVRMGLHTGLVEIRDGDYFGPSVNRAARLMAAGSGGQLLLSLVTQQLVRGRLPSGSTLRDLGAHELRDLQLSEHIFQVVIEGLPDVRRPLRAPDAASDDVLQAPGELPAECPYRGLNAFREEDAQFFFGRESFSEKLHGKVARSAFTSVIGPSGSGKSSVVFAGLVPRLHGDSGTEWSVIDMRPGTRPYHSLAGALVHQLEPHLGETARLVEIGRLAGALEDGSVTIRDAAERLCGTVPGCDRTLLVADQFEELFTLCDDERTRRGFQDLLFDAAGSSNGPNGKPLAVALTLRADFMSHALAYRPFADALQDHNVILGPMTRDELSRAIAKPAQKQGREFESGLVERIVDDVGRQPGHLPLLEFALTKLWEHQAGGWLTHDGYEAIGRVEGAVARHADTVYDALSEEDRVRAHRVFVQLVLPGEGTEDMRRRATHDELVDDWSLVGRLADARLVVTDRDAMGRETAEVVHEALIRSWGRLRLWMTSDRAFRSWQERLRSTMHQWQAVGQDEGALLHGASLAEAEEWLSIRGEDLTETESGFVQASAALSQRDAAEREGRRQRELASARQLAEAEQLRAAEQAESARRLRRRAWVLGAAGFLALALAVAAGLFASQARTESNRAESTAREARGRELAMAAEANIAADPERSVLLALEAVSATNVTDGFVLPEAATVLHSAVQSARPYTGLYGHTDWINDVAFSPDGTRLASASDDGTIGVWDTASWDLMQLIAPARFDVVEDVFGTLRDLRTNQVLDSAGAGHVGPVRATAYSPDGRWLASAGDDRTVSIWDAETGTKARSMAGHDGGVWDVAYSPDGSRIATAGADGKVITWDTATGESQLTLSGHAGDVLAVAYDPSGSRLATGGADHTARLWDTRSGKEALRLTGHSGSVTDVDFSPDGDRLLTTAGDQGGDSTARTWDTETGELLVVFSEGSDGLTAGAFAPGGRLAATVGNDRVARIWDPWSGREQYVLAGQEVDLYDVVFSPAGDVLVSAGRERSARAWDLTRAKELHTAATEAPGRTRLALGADSELLAATGAHGGFDVWRIDGGSPYKHIEAIGSDVRDLVFADDSRLIATGGGDGEVATWDATTGSRLWHAVDPAGAASRVALSDATGHVVSGGRAGLASIWSLDDPAASTPLTVEHGAGITALGLSSDGAHLATGGLDRAVRLWDASSGAPLGTLRAHSDNVNDLAFSPDGSLLASASSDRTVRIWDVDQGRVMKTLSGHAGPVSAVDFSPDGTQAASAGLDGRLGLWDLETGVMAATLARQPSGFTDVAFSPDGEVVWAGDLAGHLNAYLVNIDTLTDLARERATRGLTRQECQTYLHTDVCPARQ